MKNTQKPSAMPVHRYRKYSEQFGVDLPDRTWPDKVIDAGADLVRRRPARRQPGAHRPDEPRAQAHHVRPAREDGLQADRGRASRRRARPTSTSCAQLIEEDMIPDDVTIQVLTQAREELIARTYESIKGAKQAIVHLYNSTSILQRDVVFRTDKQGIIDIALQGAKWCKQYEATVPGTTVYYEYSPESYTGTELEFAVEVCNQVIEVFEPTPERKVIINLPATVEMATPNVYADSIEWMSRQPRPPRERAAVPAPAQRPRHGDRRGRARLPGRRRPHRGVPVRQRRAHRQRRPRRARHQPVHAGHRPADRLQRHRRGPAHRRVLQPAEGARAQPVGRRPGLHGLQRQPPGRHQEGLRGDGCRGSRIRGRRSPSCNGRCPTCRSTRKI